jgi:hypothetical protein
VIAFDAGNNIIWVDREQDLVGVLRWIDKTKYDGFVEHLMAAVR